MTAIAHQAHGCHYIVRYDETSRADCDAAVLQLTEWAETKLDGFDFDDANAMCDQIVWPTPAGWHDDPPQEVAA